MHKRSCITNAETAQGAKVISLHARAADVETLWTKPESILGFGERERQHGPKQRAFEDTPLVEKQRKRRLKGLGNFLREHTPSNCILDPIICAGSLYTLTGKTGVGKTAFLIRLAQAISFGRQDLFPQNEVDPGRVAYLTCENPTLFRMRLIAAFAELGIDIAPLNDRFLVQDFHSSADDMVASLKGEGAFRLIVIDTMQSFFDGEDSNANAQAMKFLRAVRPLTGLEGSPAVVIAAHPAKNATDDNLIPYGAGAQLNEVDGNLTLRNDGSGRVVLHWQGKLRGVDFDPVPFALRAITCDAVSDKRGKRLPMPFLDLEGSTPDAAAPILAGCRPKGPQAGAGLQQDIVAAHEALGGGKVSIEAVRNKLRDDSLLSCDEKGRLTVTARAAFCKAKKAALDKGQLREDGGWLVACH